MWKNNTFAIVLMFYGTNGVWCVLSTATAKAATHTKRSIMWWKCDEPSIIHAFQCAIAAAAVAAACDRQQIIAAFAVSIINIKIRFL